MRGGGLRFTRLRLTAEGGEVRDEGAAGREWGLNGGGGTIPAYKVGCQGSRRWSLGLTGAVDGEPEGKASEVKGEG